ncbi:hypothetical protein E4T56_gene13815 [Termitomyces sp. T112]|nr:hypothetical protein E4T56_gene13815 [Termitomyces sp. T112]
MSLFLFSSPSLSPLISLLAKYDTALSLYDDLARDISQMKKATQLVRQKILKLFETKVRRKKALGIQSEALDVLLAAETASTKPRSPVKRRDSAAGNVSPAVGLKVHFELPEVPVRSMHMMSTRRSAKEMF